MRNFFLLIFISLSNFGYAQYSSAAATSYKVIKTKGDENILNSLGNIQAKVSFDSIGVAYNMLSENEYLRFKILHEYLQDERKSGEHWKKEYAHHKNKMYERLEKVTKNPSKKKGFHISPKHENTRYEFVIILKDISDNINLEDYVAICRLVEKKSGEAILEYYVTAKSGSGVSYFHGLAEAIINHLN
jgi:hypothetical protein